MLEKQHSILDEARDKIQSQTAFCLARFPGENKFSCYQNPTTAAPRNTDYFLIKGWAKSDTVYYFLPLNNAPSKTSGIIKSVVIPAETAFEIYAEQFKAYQSAFANTKVKKAILSKLKHVEINRDFDVIDYFKKLETAYPNALVYLLLHPTEGLWIGATPEILLSNERNKWTTVSLAGTQAKSATAYKWGKKEIREQEYVSTHIRETLSANGIENYSENGPFTADAGSVVHLKTIFEFEKANEGFDFLSLAEKLHPTPAISGAPIASAIELIDNIENHKRRLYTGYLGRIGAQSVDLYVNLRCMQVFESKLVLYLGGGITQESELQSEWDETEQKAKTLLTQLNG